MLWCFRHSRVLLPLLQSFAKTWIHRPSCSRLGSMNLSKWLDEQISGQALTMNRFVFACLCHLYNLPTTCSSSIFLHSRSLLKPWENTFRCVHCKVVLGRLLWKGLLAKVACIIVLLSHSRDCTLLHNKHLVCRMATLSYLPCSPLHKLFSLAMPLNG